MIDLHVHSTISDGMDSPKEIVKKAKTIGLTAVALTDHNCIEGLKEAKREANKLGITFINGIELSVSYGNGRQLHILGLGIDPEETNFKKSYLTYKQSRHDQINYSILELNKLGIYPKPHELDAISTDGFLDRQTLAKWLVINGYTKSIPSSWIEYLDHYPHIEGELIDIATALDMIKSAGGKSFMAHYHKQIGLLGYDEEECHDILSELKSLGLDGLERYYSDYNALDHKKLDEYIETHDFITSGGSDYHGSNRPSVELGSGTDSLSVPDKLLNPISEFAYE